MKKIGIMQPYFFPYIGYFSLIKNTDCFVFFDTPQYIKRGWVNRNRIIHQNEAFNYITVPLCKAPQETAIMDMQIDKTVDWRKKILGQLDIYKKKAKHFDEVYGLVTDIFEQSFDTISELNIYSTKAICEYLGIKKPFYTFSEMNLNIPEVKAPDEWALHITKAMGYDTYINPPGGMDFFDNNKYKDAGINLQFLKSNLQPYVQKRGYFEPGLSIIDVLMFNDKEAVLTMLDDYQIINGNEVER